MSFKELLKEQTIDKSRARTLVDCSGTITKINYQRGTADVLINNQFGSGKITIRGARLISTDGYLKGSSYSNGDIVELSFSGGSPAGARIIGAKSGGDKSTHEISNSTPDTNHNILGVSISARSALDTTAYGYISDIDSIVKAIEVDSIGFLDSEIGITSSNDSVIKTLGNGDLFFGTGHGASMTIKNNGYIEINSLGINKK